MPMNHSYQPWSGVGVVSIHQRSAAGAPLAGFDMGETPSFKIQLTQPTAEMKTSRDTSRGVAFKMAQSAGGTVELKIATLTDGLLSLLTQGAWTDSAAGAAVTGWTAPTAEVGQVIALPSGNVSAVTITDSTATPKTLVAGTDYVLDAFAGTILVRNLTGYTQPLKAAYTPGAIRTMGALKAVNQDWYMKFAGTNSYDGTRALVDAFRVNFAADGDSPWIQEGYGEWTLKGTILRDITKLDTSPGGQYYAVRRP